MLKKFIDQIFWTIPEMIYFIYKIISFFLNITKIKKFIFFKCNFSAFTYKINKPFLLKKKNYNISKYNNWIFLHIFVKEIFFSGNLGTWLNSLLHL